MYTPLLSAGIRRAAAAMLVCAAPALALHTRAAAQGCSPAVSLTGTTLCGTTVNTAVNDSSTAVGAFMGIQYATAARWQAPAAATLPDTVNATQPGAICPQLQYTSQTQSFTTGSENCLFLNVWQPQGASPATPLPVMVFIHGGTFFAGAGSLGAYDGTYLAAAGNVVVVTLNYRLGALGWLTTDTLQLSIAPNLGLQDQQMALSWVQKNIAAFGGDPTRVTIFGESAGAMSVGLHLFSIPTSAPLFRAAIMESNLMGVPYRDTTEAQGDGAGFVAQLCDLYGPRHACPDSMATWLQGLSMQQIMSADSAYRIGKPLKDRLDTWGMPEMLPWSPVVDGTFVTGQPSAGYAAGMPAKPYIFGMNLNEGVLFAGLIEGALTGLGFDFEYPSILSYLYDANYVDTIISLPNNGYQPYASPNDSATHTFGSPETAFANVLGDALFHCGNLAAANTVVATQPDSLPVLAYLFAEAPVFNHGPPSTDGCLPQAGNVCHTYELPYVFNTFAYADSVAGSITPTAADSSLARAMPVAWAYFATNLAPPLSVWKPYTTNGGLYVWGGPTNGSMIQGWNNARNCTALWYTLPPRG